MRARRKPLVIRGARQVGKSYLVSMFAEQNFSNFIEINFEKDQEVISLFSGTPEKIIKLLELRYNKIIDIENTLLFLDEIQAAPEVFAKLRYFYEDLPGLHIIAAGSLLEFILEEHTFSMPVGRIEYLHLGPMTFEEFLAANGKTMLVDFIQNYWISEDLPDAVHSDLVSLFKTYLIIGGMPEAVLVFSETNSFYESEIVKESILGTYEDDSNKYSTRVNHMRLLNVFKKLPLMVGKKFKYVNVDRNERAQDIEKALHLLEMAKITYRVKHSACNGVPLGSQVNEKKFKLLFLDVGLMAGACGMSMIDIDNADDLMMVNSGSLCEQFAGQHLLYSDEYYKKPDLFYWVREAKSSSAEVDYIISSGSKIIPVEIKAGKTGRLKSLHQFIKEKGVDSAVRINLAKPSVLQDSNKLPGGQSIEYRLLSMPFYLIGQIRRLISAM
ncbi:AAA family ATPase [Desulfobacula sp.]|uniref:ATP-binding protein n=1 Tax=Desulfobacula sp. TaxID=2593537 RepID=UPI00262E71B0|nr:AAA family ATPase [Desulfobacula sp.]